MHAFKVDCVCACVCRLAHGPRAATLSDGSWLSPNFSTEDLTRSNISVLCACVRACVCVCV